MTALAFGASLLPILLAAAIGLLGWKLAALARFPAPAMIGPMLAMAVAVSSGAPLPSLPAWLRIGVQCVIGGFIGRRIDRSAFRAASRMLPAIAVATTWYVASGAAIGLLVARFSSIEPRTALLATAPAGVAEMTALAISMGADSALVATMQALRVLVTNLSVPFAVRRGVGGSEPAKGAGLEIEAAGAASEPDAAEGPGAARSVREPEAAHGGLAERHWAIGLVAALAGGWLFTAIGVPAGAVVGGMLGLALLRIAGVGPAPIPKAAVTTSYMVLGISAGLSFGSGTLERLRASAAPLGLGTLATLASGLLLALVVRRMMRLDLRTALLACSPAGLSLMAVIAEETGAQTLVVSLFQLVRVVWVILAVPFVLRFLG